jgi:hypothetical protein
VKLRPERSEALKRLAASSASFGALPGRLYLLRWPSIEVRLPQACALGERWPSSGDQLIPGWHRIRPVGYEDVLWAYDERASGSRATVLACNGIAVGSMDGAVGLDSKAWDKEAGINLMPPTVSVFDPDGRFPLVLTRTRLSCPRLPFQSELIADILRDIVAWCLVDPTPAQWWDRAELSHPGPLPSCVHPALGRRFGARPYVLMADGFALQEDWIVRQLPISTLVVVSATYMALPLPVPGVAITRTEMPWFGPSDADELARGHLGHSAMGLEYDSLRISLPVAISERWPNKRVGKRCHRSMRLEAENGVCHCSSGGRQTANYSPAAKPHSSPWAVAQYGLKNTQPEAADASRIGKAFVRHLGTCVLPYAVADRRRLFRAAFAELGEFIEAHEAALKQRPRN